MTKDPEIWRRYGEFLRKLDHSHDQISRPKTRLGMCFGNWEIHTKIALVNWDANHLYKNMQIIVNPTIFPQLYSQFRLQYIFFQKKNKKQIQWNNEKHTYWVTGRSSQNSDISNKHPCHFRCTLRLLKAFFQRRLESSGGGSERGKSRDGPYFLVENLFPKKGKNGWNTGVSPEICFKPRNFWALVGCSHMNSCFFFDWRVILWSIQDTSLCDRRLLGTHKYCWSDLQSTLTTIVSLKVSAMWRQGWYQNFAPAGEVRI